MSKIALERLFQFQDEAAVYNVAHSERLRRLLAFVRESVALLTELFDAMHFAALRIASRTAFCAVVSTIGRSRAKLRRSPLIAYWRAGNVTLRPAPVRRSQWSCGS